MYSYRKKNIIMIVMMAAVLFMAVGYALLSSTLNISGISDLTGSWGVKITDVSYQATGKAYNISEPTYTDTTVKFNVGVKVPGDKMTFTVTVQNFGNIDALLMNIDASASGTESIIYSINGINNQEVLKEGESKTFTVTTYFDINATELPTITTKDLTVKLNYVQYDDQTLNARPPQITDVTTQYGIMYMGNGGSGSMDGVVCTEGEICTLTANSFVRNGYLFKGWSTTPNGKVEYNNGQAVVDLANTGKTQKLYAVWDDLRIVSQIKNDNDAKIDTYIDFSQLASNTNGKGLYYTSTNTEGNQPTYYFRGDVQNNYVKFGKDSSGNDILWRIVRINEDGSIRLITENSVGTSVFNTNYDDNAYVGYMYGLPETSTVYGDVTGDGVFDTNDTVDLNQYFARNKEYTEKQKLIADFNFDGELKRNDLTLATQVLAGWSYSINNYSNAARYKKTHANLTDSTIKTYIDNWYASNLSSYSNYLVDAGFCNDRSVATRAGVWKTHDTALGYGRNETAYGIVNRNFNLNQPQFKCPQINDLFTTGEASKGNKKLSNPIGLLTADEAIYAGLNVYDPIEEQQDVYLLRGKSWLQMFWTMTPRVSYEGYSSGDDGAAMWVAGHVYELNDPAVVYDFSLEVRPVINIKPTLKITSSLPGGCTEQNGTLNCPYIIDTDNNSSSSNNNTFVVNVASSNKNYGTVTPDSQSVNKGSSAVVTLTPATGHQYVSNTCGGTVSGNTMTIPNVTQNISCTVVFERNVIKLSNKILSDNTAYADNVSSPYVSSSTGISFSAISSDTNGKGLYVTSDLTKTEDIDGDGTGEEVYYYRGAVTNNFVQFGAYPAGTTVNGTTYSEETPMYWRIIRINEDGSIRMIYNGTSADATGSDVTIGTSAFNSSYNDNAYVGYMYRSTGSSNYATTHANINTSTIKKLIDNWYTNNTNLSSLRTNYLADAGFCNDRSVAPTAKTWGTSDTALGYAKNITYYGAYNRLRNEYQPQFVCPNAGNDLFTTSESSKGNNALSNPIGLITADELVYAGGVYNKTNNSYYLKTGEYWTMSASYFSGYYAVVWIVHLDGNLYYNVDQLIGVRPVINLTSTVELSDGLPSGCTTLDGTAACPYIIKTN